MSKRLEIFGDRLKALRMERALSLRALAKNLSISDIALGRWERKLQVPNIDMLTLIADYFNVTPNYLLGYEDFI